MHSTEGLWQASLLKAIQKPDQPLADIDEKALEVYRNNYRVCLIDTLSSIYPVIKALVGDEFFVGLARMYIKQHPSLSGNLHHYGTEFARFLDGFGPAKELPYLPDVAKLEWRVHCAHYARDAKPLNPANFGNVAADEWPHLLLNFAPAVALVLSHWPIGKIWQMHQKDVPSDWEIDLDSGGEAVLVTRPLNKVTVDVLPPATGAWLCALLRGASLEEATETVLELEAGSSFDMQSALKTLLERQALTGFEQQDPAVVEAI